MAEPSLTFVNMLTGRRDRYYGIDPEDRLLVQAEKWLSQGTDWFPIGDLEFHIKVEHLGPTWAHFLLCWMRRDRIATRCFVCLDAGASRRAWGMAKDEQAWSEDLRRILRPEPKVPWIAVVVPDDIPIAPGLYQFCVPIERAMAWAIMRAAG